MDLLADGLREIATRLADRSRVAALGAAQVHHVGRPKHHNMVRQPTHTAKREYETVRSPAIRLRPNGHDVVHVLAEMHNSGRAMRRLDCHAYRVARVQAKPHSSAWNRDTEGKVA